MGIFNWWHRFASCQVSAWRSPVAVAVALTTLVIGTLGAGVLVPGLPARADEITDTEALAVRVADRLAQLEAEALEQSGRYERLSYARSQAREQLATAQAAVVAAEADYELYRSSLVSYAVGSYMKGQQMGDVSEKVFTEPATELRRRGYASALAEDRDRLYEEMLAAAMRRDAEATRLTKAELAYDTQADELEEVIAETNRTLERQRLYNEHVQGELRWLVAREQERRDGYIRRNLGREAVNTAAAGTSAAVVLDAALSRLGTPYVYGANGPDAYDCSGLVKFAFAQAGVVLPRYSGAMWESSTQIARAELVPGDLVFWGEGGSEHVAIYAGADTLVHAYSAGVSVTVLDGWWKAPSGYGRALG